MELYASVEEYWEIPSVKQTGAKLWEAGDAKLLYFSQEARWHSFFLFRGVDLPKGVEEGLL